MIPNVNSLSVHA